VTNLVEKSLLTGFGIFTLIIFFIFISPFFQEIENYENNTEDDLDEIMLFIHKVDEALHYFIDNSQDNYLVEIQIPTNINITFINNYVKFDFMLENNIHSKVLNFDERFIQKYFYEFTSSLYQMNISLLNTLINVEFNKF
jgi:hypothetical protein